MLEDVTERLAASLRALVTRGKIATAAIAGRTIAQVTGLAGETKQSVEVLHPFGWFANLPAGADLVLIQVLGSRDHVVALGGDVLGQSQPCAAGEFGAMHASGAFFHFTNDGKLTFQDASGAQVILENDGTIYIKGALRVSGDITDNCNAQTETMAGARAVYDIHTHPVPNVQTGSGTATTAVPTQQET
ncbi:MAG: hypothetical protein HIU82_02110 [Proteobacteria bacterium]|nr:hypothetical protein [Pseudomonadota bacterium]